MNLAKLFKLPKKLGDSLLISLINNMVDYLRTYDSAIKVDDDGYIHLAADTLYLEGNGSDVDIYSNDNIYLYSDGELTLNISGQISLYTENENPINLSSDGGINLVTNNEQSINLSSDGSIYLASNNGHDIGLSSDSNMELTSAEDMNLICDGDGSINLKNLCNGDHDRRLIVWGDNDGLEYRQDNETFFQIDKDGLIHIKPYDEDGASKILQDYILGNTEHNFTIQNTLSENIKIILYNNINSITQPINANSSGNFDLYLNRDNPYIIFEIEYDEQSIRPSDQIVISLWNGNSIIRSYYYPIDGNNDNYTTKQILIKSDAITKIVIGNTNYCYTADTLITLADGSTKQVKDITYDDELKVWNFDEGKDDVAKPLWIKRTEYAKSYQLVTLSNGNIIKLCGNDGRYHCMFDVTEQKFNHAVDCIGHEVYTENGIATVVSIEEVKEKVDHYNIVTNYHMNLYANHILTSTEKNNIYPIADMKFVKDDRKIVPYEEFEKAHISREYYDGWRAGEWSEPLKDVITHLRRRKMYAKPQKRVKDGLRTDYFG